MQEDIKNDDKNKAEDVSAKEEDDPHMVRIARKTKIPPRTEGTVLVATDARGLV